MLEGKPIMELPFWQRRRQLQGIFSPYEKRSSTGPVELAAQYEIGKVNLFHKSIQGEENEGIVLKQINSVYNGSDSRCLQNPYWLKVKRVEKHIYTGGA
jgi:ATP-dependent DNA ligase